MPDFITSRQTLLLYLKARIPFISLRTDERDRALDLTRALAPQLNIPIYYHTLSQGMRELVPYSTQGLLARLRSPPSTDTGPAARSPTLR